MWLYNDFYNLWAYGNVIELNCALLSAARNHFRNARMILFNYYYYLLRLETASPIHTPFRLAPVIPFTSVVDERLDCSRGGGGIGWNIMGFEQRIVLKIISCSLRHVKKRGDGLQVTRGNISALTILF